MTTGGAAKSRSEALLQSIRGSGWDTRIAAVIAAVVLVLLLVQAVQEPGQFARPANKLKSSNYHFALTPRAVDDMRFYGYCTALTLGLVRERVERIGSRKVRDYYRRLEREADLVKVWSPYRKGAERPPFNFDLSYNYYPGAFSRPGPEIKLYRLRNCRQGVGPSAVRVPRTPKVPLGAPPEDA